jgi:gliding motility-associated lipoprotein GldD
MNKLWIFLLIPFLACNDSYTPKPRGFSRIDFPQKTMSWLKTDCPFQFLKPSYLVLKEKKENCWFDLHFEQFNGTLHMSYKEVRGNVNKYIEESRDLAYKHSKVAQAINEQAFVNKSANVYGLVYTFEGATASGIQFYLTDSTQHFVRGALYFNTAISDSLMPINNFINQDVYNIVESWEWK